MENHWFDYYILCACKLKNVRVEKKMLRLFIHFFFSDVESYIGTLVVTATEHNKKLSRTHAFMREKRVASAPFGYISNDINYYMEHERKRRVSIWVWLRFSDRSFVHLAINCSKSEQINRIDFETWTFFFLGELIALRCANLLNESVIMAERKTAAVFLFL